MGLHDEFESSRSHILHQDLLPTVSEAIHKLIDDETRLQTDPISIQTMVLATPATVPHTTTPIYPSATLQEIHSLPTENSVGNINNSVGN